MSTPIIAGVEITTDAEGRFNLNALHRASGLGAHKAPNRWLSIGATEELLGELESQTPPEEFGPINTVRGGNAPGTFAHELLAISYAGWISPAFQLKVNQVFLDYRSGKLAGHVNQPAIPQSLPEALRLAADEHEARVKAEEQLAVAAPKAAALDRIATSDGSLCITDAAKDLQVRRKDLIQWMKMNRWIYKRTGNNAWLGYQDRVQANLLEHKMTTIERSDGSEKVATQVRVTPKGLARLSELVA